MKKANHNKKKLKIKINTLKNYLMFKLLFYKKYINNTIILFK